MSPHRHRHPVSEWGFTMMELMVVMLLLGTVLLIVPLNMGGTGARGRLEETGNSLVASFSAAREQAILDGRSCYLEIGYDAEGLPATRYRFTTNPTAKSTTQDNQEEARRVRTDEIKWAHTSWKPFQRGIKLLGVSERHGSWRRINEGSKVFEVRFLPNGHIENAVAVRIESEDLEDVRREFRTYTIIVNALTSEARMVEGLQDLPESLSADRFN